MRWNTLLARTGFKRQKDGRYLDPVTDKKVKLETALDRSAKFHGYKNYKGAKEAFASKAYKRIVDGGYKTKKGVQPAFAKQAAIPNDYRLQKLFADAWNARDKDKSKELAQLLKYVGKINKYRAVYAGAL